jgi:hypothetical protein
MQQQILGKDIGGGIVALEGEPQGRHGGGLSAVLLLLYLSGKRCASFQQGAGSSNILLLKGYLSQQNEFLDQA